MTHSKSLPSIHHPSHSHTQIHHPTHPLKLNPTNEPIHDVAHSPRQHLTKKPKSPSTTKSTVKVSALPQLTYSTTNLPVYYPTPTSWVQKHSSTVAPIHFTTPTQTFYHQTSSLAPKHSRTEVEKAFYPKETFQPTVLPALKVTHVKKKKAWKKHQLNKNFKIHVLSDQPTQTINKSPTQVTTTTPRFRGGFKQTTLHPQSIYSIVTKFPQTPAPAHRNPQAPKQPTMQPLYSTVTAFPQTPAPAHRNPPQPKQPTIQSPFQSTTVPPTPASSSLSPIQGVHSSTLPPLLPAYKADYQHSTLPPGWTPPPLPFYTSSTPPPPPAYSTVETAYSVSASLSASSMQSSSSITPGQIFKATPAPSYSTTSTAYYSYSPNYSTTPAPALSLSPSPSPTPLNPPVCYSPPCSVQPATPNPVVQHPDPIATTFPSILYPHPSPTSAFRSLSTGPTDVYPKVIKP